MNVFERDPIPYTYPSLRFIENTFYFLLISQLWFSAQDYFVIFLTSLCILTHFSSFVKPFLTFFLQNFVCIENSTNKSLLITVFLRFRCDFYKWNEPVRHHGLLTADIHCSPDR